MDWAHPIETDGNKRERQKDDKSTVFCAFEGGHLINVPTIVNSVINM